MRLLAWREKENMTRVKLAELLGIAEGQNPSQRLRNYEIGVSAFPLELVPILEKITKGEVTVPDLIAPYTEHKARQASQPKEKESQL